MPLATSAKLVSLLGLEPRCLAAADFESAVSTISNQRDVVRDEGLEPPRISPPVPETGAATITPVARFCAVQRERTRCRLRVFPHDQPGECGPLDTVSRRLGVFGLRAADGAHT